MDNCIFCNNHFSDLSIKKYDNWEIQLFRDDQYYIGRSAIVFKDRHIEFIPELKEDEHYELFDTVIPDLKNALDEIFSPDLYNYSKIGNDCSHLHIHVIPRYKNSREFNNIQFEDEFWNETYAQDYENIKLDENTLNKLINQIQEHID